MAENTKADPNNIREMDLLTDLDQVKKIWLNEVKKAHPLISENFWDSRIPTFIKETQNAKECYVYKRNGEIVGFTTAWPTLPETAYIAELYVDSPHQREEIGTALFETLKGENPKFPQLKGRYQQFISHVYAHNYISFPWHIKNKFKITGIHFCPNTGLPKFDMIWKKDNSVG